MTAILGLAISALKEGRSWLVASIGVGAAFIVFLRNENVQLAIAAAILGFIAWLIKAIIEAVWKFAQAKTNEFFVEFESIGNSISSMSRDLEQLQNTNKALSQTLSDLARHHQDYEKELQSRMQDYENRMDNVEKDIVELRVIAGRS